MNKNKYVFNPKTMQYERVQLGPKGIVKRVFLSGAFILLASFLLNHYYHEYFPSAKEIALQNELEEVKYNYSAITEEINQLTSVLENIKERDESVYGLVLGVDPIDPSVWAMGTGGHQSALLKYNNSSDLIASTKASIDKIQRQSVLFSKSLDNVEELASMKSDRLASIPSIKPVRKDKLKRGISLLSGFGMRMHPVHNIRKMHTGLDFTCPVGTKVRATGNGVIEKVEYRTTGYGKNIIINHGYGYETRYAHLSSIDVKEGQKVEKGEAIGDVGNTGTSTAPHLHYEVIFNDKPVNPLDFCLDGLTPSEYAELVNQASRATQSFD